VASAVSNMYGTQSDSSSSSTTLGSTAPSQAMFLKLLVAQLQNQDPLNPTDSTQFVSQLAQFSELEQIIAIRGDIESAQQTTTTSTSTSSADQNSQTTKAQS
jgi:flagellar basal-body rod modification protein FlgD